MKIAVFLVLIFISLNTYGQIVELKCIDSNTYKECRTDTTIICACYDSNDKKNGLEIIYSLDSVKIFETQYLDGKKHGEEKEFYSSGNVWRIVNYENGIKHGRFAAWFDNIESSSWQNGEQIGEGTFVNGTLEGYYVVRTAMSGGVIYATIMKNGKEAIIGRYINWTKANLPKLEDLPKKELKKLTK